MASSEAGLKPVPRTGVEAMILADLPSLAMVRERYCGPSDLVRMPGNSPRGASMLANLLSRPTRPRVSHDVNGVKVANFLAEGELTANDVRELVTNVRGQLGESAAVVIGGGITADKVNVVVATNDAARKKNLNAGEILNAVLAKLDGKGGGKPDMAQGAGTNTKDAKNVIAGVDNLIR